MTIPGLDRFLRWSRIFLKKNYSNMTTESLTHFSDMDLDSRLTRALSKLNFDQPTLVQQTAIPLALQGKDILAKAKTGSGKTIAYLIPVIQKVISNQRTGIQALILVPTKELAHQVYSVIKDLIVYCPKIQVLNIAIGDISVKAQIPKLQELPDILISTPSRIAEHLKDSNVVLQETLESLVIDEADLILSYGYDQDVEIILKHLPQIYQSYLMSATFSPDVAKLKKLILRNPAILQLEENAEKDLLTQYYINCTEEEKYLLVLFMLKLKVHPFGSQKSIFFVNSIDRCYKLKLFLEQFGIKSCTLNSELPVKSRYHIVQEFNRGVYDYIIATDEAGELLELAEEEAEDKAEKLAQEKAIALAAETAAEIEGTEKVPTPIEAPKPAAAVEHKSSKKMKNPPKQDREYGVARGIDFKNVAAVINFDMPRSSKSYQHRVGRTARGVGNKGYALSFVCPDAEKIVHTRKKVSNLIIVAMGRVLYPFQFDMTPVEKFRYRCTDALRAVTETAVREARVKELKTEILNSEKLKVSLVRLIPRHILKTIQQIWQLYVMTRLSIQQKSSRT
jgi:ATP-dependent RNA helicase DDX56/DBP9